MLANIKFKAIDDLKMTRAETSDDFLEKWLELEEKKRMKIKQTDDDMIYEEKFNVSAMRAKENSELVLALNNVLTLASERLDIIQVKGMSIGYQPIFNKNKKSIKIVKEFLYNCQVKKDD